MIRALVFVSHALKYKFYDVVVAVMEQYASKHPDAYFWCNLFTKIKMELPPKISTTFRNSINSIG